MKATSRIADTRRESPYPRRTEWERPHTHPIQTVDPASTLHTPQTPHPQSIHPRHITDPASTRSSPRTGPQTLHSPLAPPLTRHTPAHTSHTALSSLAQHPPCRPRTQPASTPHTWHNPQTLHPCHTPRTRHRPHSSPRAHRTLRVRRARSQRSRSFGRRSRPCPSRRAAPAGRGGSAELLRPEIRRGGAPAASRGRGRELLATLHGPRSPAPPARSLSPAPRVAGDPRTPASGHAAGLARRSPLPFSPLTARRHLPQRCSRSETHSSAPAADTDSAEAAAGALRS